MANSATKPRNNELKDIRFAMSKLNHPHGGSSVSFDYMMGDLLFWDDAAAYVKPLASDANAQYLVGVSLRGSYLAPFASMQQSGGPGMVKNYYLDALVGFGAIFSFYSTAGDTYNHLDPIFFGTDAQTITNQAATHSIGVVMLPTPGTTAIAGGSTVLVPVLVIPQIPVQSL